MQPHRLRKHADYQRVYRAGRKQFTKNIAYFYALRSTTPESYPAAETSGPRVGLTVPKALGNAVVRNRIKRRLREAARHALPLLQAPVDLVLHPRRVVLEMEFAQLEREVAGLFRSVQAACKRVSAQDAAPVAAKDANAAVKRDRPSSTAGVPAKAATGATPP